MDQKFEDSVLGLTSRLEKIENSMRKGLSETDWSAVENISPQLYAQNGAQFVPL